MDKLFSDHLWVQEWWAEVDPPTVSLNISGVTISVPNLLISEKLPMSIYISKAISRLKNGIYGIFTELLKAGSELMARSLLAVLVAIWQSSTIPFDLLRDVAIPFWKGKEDC